MTCLLLNISPSLLKAEKGRGLSPSSFLILYTHSFCRTTPIIQANGVHYHFFIRIPIMYLAVRSSQFCWQIPFPGCNSGTDLIVVLEYTFLITYQISQVQKIQKKLCRLLWCTCNQPLSKLNCFILLFKVTTFIFCSCLSPMIVHLSKLFLLSTPVARRC